MMTYLIAINWNTHTNMVDSLVKYNYDKRMQNLIKLTAFSHRDLPEEMKQIGTAIHALQLRARYQMLHLYVIKTKVKDFDKVIRTLDYTQLKQLITNKAIKAGGIKCLTNPK